ncbi:MAG: hypothetical protein LBL19_08245 [Spirochaetaceae bacterium]|jgi:hypothetical protein|nr:hypothetical protein [Spirochaetaceae bacterium]
MAKKFLALTGIVMLLLGSSCASTKSRVFDKEIPEEQMATVLFHKGIKVMQFNGQEVLDDWYGLYWTSGDKVKARIPSGMSNVLLSITHVSGNTVIETGDLEVQFAFMPGQSYTVKFFYHSGEKAWCLGIYDKLPLPILGFQRGELVKYWTFST